MTNEVTQPKEEKTEPIATPVAQPTPDKRKNEKLNLSFTNPMEESTLYVAESPTANFVQFMVVSPGAGRRAICSLSYSDMMVFLDNLKSWHVFRSEEVKKRLFPKCKHMGAVDISTMEVSCSHFKKQCHYSNCRVCKHNNE